MSVNMGYVDVRPLPRVSFCRHNSSREFFDLPDSQRRSYDIIAAPFYAVAVDGIPLQPCPRCLQPFAALLHD